MAKRRHTPEQIVVLLREAEVELAKGRPLAEVCRKLEIHEQTSGSRTGSGWPAAGTRRSAAAGALPGWSAPRGASLLS